VKDYSRGIGVLDLAKSIDSGVENRTNGPLILHMTEAMEGLLRSSETEELYRMTTTCQRPRPIAAGGFPEQV